MIVIDGFGIVCVIWFAFVIAATFSWAFAYLHGVEDPDYVMVFGRHWIGCVVGVILSWWIVGKYTAPFFDHPYIAMAVITHVLTSFGLAFALVKFCVTLRSSRIAKLMTEPGQKVMGPTYELEWVCFTLSQTLLMVLWGLNEWRKLP